MATSRIAVLMTCHNRCKTTLTCLAHLYAQRMPDNVKLHTFLVDDGSEDGTWEAVHKQFPTVNILKGNGQLYWCGGMRFAWNEASKYNYDYYLWLNDDTMLFPDAIDTMLNTAHCVRQKKHCDGIVVGSCRDPETGRHTYGGRVKRNERARLADKPLPPTNYVMPCDTMNGNLVLIPRDVYYQLGNLSPLYTHAFGDVDYGMRARCKNIPIFIAPGYIAECPVNSGIRPWINPKVSFIKRWKDMCSPHGLPPRQWYRYVKRHTGVLWPVYLMKPIVRLCFPRLWNIF